jgi:cytochrome c biogenesis protein CcdA
MSPEGDDNRPEIAVAVSFGVTILGAVVFAVAYALGGQTQVLGASLAVAFGGLAVGLTVWSLRLVQTGGYVEEHEGFASPDIETDELTHRLTAVARPNRRGLLPQPTRTVGTARIRRGQPRYGGAFSAALAFAAQWRPCSCSTEPNRVA